MPLYLRVAAAVAAVLSTLSAGALLFAAQAQTPPAAATAALAPPTIAVVDFHAVIRESAAAKDIRSQIDKYYKSYDADIQATEKNLMAEDKELAQSRPNPPTEQWSAKRRAFETKVQDAQKRIVERQRKLDQSYSQAVSQIEKKAIDIIAEIASARKINMVVGKHAIVITEPRFELSKEVLEKLNMVLPAVKVTPPPP